MGVTMGENILKKYIILQSVANAGSGGKDLNLRPSGYEFYVPLYYLFISTYIH